MAERAAPSHSAFSLGPAGVGAALIVAAGRVIGARDQLCDLDARAGDGDLGVTLATGFAKVSDRLESGPADDVGVLLKSVGLELARHAPSTMGTLLATSYLRAGGLLAGLVRLDPTSLAIWLDAMAATVSERGRVTTGQRTALDAMRPAADAAADAARDGADLAQTASAAAGAAALDADQTAEMEPQVGRAGWIGERARGAPDAGAVAWAIFLSGLAEGLTLAARESSAPHNSG